MVCDDEWYNSVNKVCKAVELHLVNAACRVLPHVKMMLIVALALCEARLRPRVVTVGYILGVGCVGALKLAVFRARALVVHSALLYVYSVDPHYSPALALIGIVVWFPSTWVNIWLPMLTAILHPIRVPVCILFLRALTSVLELSVSELSELVVDI